MQGVDELAGVRASRGSNDADLIRETCDLVSRHAFEIDPDPEVRGEVASAAKLAMRRERSGSSPQRLRRFALSSPALWSIGARSQA
jgi:hypothetical protein